MQEQWKQIMVDEIVYDYEVSSHGQVRNMKTGRILKATKNSKGYSTIGLHRNGKKTTMLVHRLVALMFIPNNDIQHKTDVNHIDENKTNNCVSNLEWTTHKENCNHGTSIERSAKAHCKKVLCVETGIIYDSAVDAQKQTGLPKQSISRCCNGTKYYKTVGGYHWQYVD